MRAIPGEVLASGIRAADDWRNTAPASPPRKKECAMSAVEQPVLTKEEQEEFIKQGGLAAFREVGATKYQGDEEEVDAQAIADGIYPLVLKHRVEELEA